MLVSAGVLGCGPGTAACCVASGKLLHISGQQSPRKDGVGPDEGTANSFFKIVTVLGCVGLAASVDTVVAQEQPQPCGHKSWAWPCTRKALFTRWGRLGRASLVAGV